MEVFTINIAVLFPGQGSQYVGMGKYIHEDIVKKKFSIANEVLGFNLEMMCKEGSFDELTKTENAQPAILTISVSAFDSFMREFEIIPAFLAGHSLGEITALTCSGAIEFHDAIEIVRARGRFMQEAVPDGMGAMVAVIDIDRKEIEKYCVEYGQEEKLVIANYNSSNQVVISGHINALDRVSDKLKQKGASVIPLKVSAPFHSPYMKKVADKFNDLLLKYNYHALKYPVISNLNALPYQDKDSIVGNLTKQLYSPVQWEATMQLLLNSNLSCLLEMSPKTVLRDLTIRSLTQIKVFSYDNEKDQENFRQHVQENNDANASPDLLKIINRCLAIAVCTQNSNWNNEEYRLGVEVPYKKVQKMREEIEARHQQPRIDQAREAIIMLQSVFKTKGTSEEESRNRFAQMVQEANANSIYKDLFDKQ